MTWTSSHFLTIPLAYAAILALALLSRRLRPDARLWGYRIVLIVLYVGEAVKQVLGLIRGYPLNYIPLHFSSTFYICFSLFAFGRGAVRQTGACVSFISGFFLFVAMTVNPTAVVGDTSLLFTDYVRAHSYFYHVLVLLMWGMLLAQDAYRPKKGDVFKFWIYLLCWAVPAVIGSYALNVNYAGILKSYIPLLEKVREAAGDAVYLLAYTAFAFALSGLIVWCYGRIRAAIEQRTAPAKKHSAA